MPGEAIWHIYQLKLPFYEQGFKLAALRNKFVKFYKSKLNIWGKYGSDIYDDFIEMFQLSYIIL